jgi:hypothetical protein
MKFLGGDRGPWSQARWARRRQRWFAAASVHRRPGFRVLGEQLYAMVLVFGYFMLEMLSPWSLGTTLRHIAAAPNCDAARAVGLAPANRGEPGYWPSHDADRDGIACEPWPYPRRTKRRY